MNSSWDKQQERGQDFYTVIAFSLQIAGGFQLSNFSWIGQIFLQGRSSD